MILAIDFDHTIYFEDMRHVNIPLIEKLIKARRNGHKLILWTCRGGEHLAEAIKECLDYGLSFDAVNENIKGRAYENVSVKVVADLYIDDKAPNSIGYFMENF